VGIALAKANQQGVDMIEMMRTKAGSWIAKILAGLLILSFAVWGIGDVIRGPVIGEVVAKVGGTEISRNELSDQVRRLLSVMRRQLGGNFDAQQATQLGLIDQTVDQLVNSRLITLETQTLGLGAGEDLIRQTILNDKRFQTAGGQFDRLAFRRYLQNEDLSEARYVDLLRQEITQSQVTNALRTSAYAPKALLNTIYKYRNEQRVAEIVKIPFGKASDIRTPKEGELVEFHKKNPAQFTAPEYRQVTAIFLDPVEVAKELTPSAERIKQEYEYRKETRTVPERRALEQILFQDEAKAKSFSDIAKSGRAFSLSAKENAKAEPNDLGNLRKQDLPSKVGDAAFKLSVNGVTSPIRTALGWHVVHVKKIEAGRTPTFDSLKLEINSDLAREMAVDNIVKLTGKLDDALAGGASLEDAAATVSAKILKFASVDSTGKGPDGKPVIGLPKSPLFIEKIVTTPKGETTNVEETQKGEFFVLKVEAITAPALKPLSAVRNQIVGIWKQSQVRGATKKKAETLQKAAQNSVGISAAGKTGGYDVKTSKPVSRFIKPQGSIVSDSLLGTLFKAKKGDVVIAASNNGYSIAEIKQVIAAEPGTNKTEEESLATQLNNVVSADAITQYLAALRKAYPVSIDRNAVTQAVTGRAY
jgi:peptidyl-prolyl cis-trans isomerase D